MSLKRLDRVRRTIGFRLILWYSSIFIVSASFLFVLAYVLLSSSAEQKNRKDIHLKLEEYAAQYRAGGLEALKNEVDLEERSGKTASFFVRVAGPQNRTLFLDDPELWAEFDLKQLESRPFKGNEQWVRLPTRGGDNTLEIESTLLADGALLEVGKTNAEGQALLERFREIFVGFMIPVVILGLVGGWFLAYRALRPVRGLVQTIRSISTGQMSARVPAGQAGDELDELVMLFNAMLGKIEALINGMRGSLDNVAFQFSSDPPPNVAIGSFSFGKSTNQDNLANPDERHTQLVDNFSLTIGRHNFKFGGEMEYIHEDLNKPNNF